MLVLFMILCVVGFITQMTFIKVEYKGDMRKALLLKGLAAIIFVAAGFSVMKNCTDVRHAQFIVIGLFMGFVGDVLLNLQYVVKNGGKLFVIGAGAFLIGHMFYSLSWGSYISGFMSTIIAAVVAIGIMLWVYQHITVESIGLKVFGVVYLGVAVLATSFAVESYIRNPQNLSSIVFAIGGMLFIFSDVVLFFNMFGNKKKWMRATNLTTYYLGQLFIAASLIFAIV